MAMPFMSFTAATATLEFPFKELARGFISGNRAEQSKADRLMFGTDPQSATKPGRKTRKGSDGESNVAFVKMKM